MEGSRVLTATSSSSLSLVVPISKTHRSSTPVFHRSSSGGKFAPIYPLLWSIKSPPTLLHCVSSSSLSSSSEDNDDVILLNVSGMMCEGCASSVKRILENQTQVSSATVNLATETATVWPISEAKVAPNWQKVIGEELAKNLTNSGFNSNLKGEAATEGTQS